MRGSRLKLWKTKPMLAIADLGARVAVECRRRRGRRAGSVPRVGRSRQPRMFMSVDLPEPDGAHDRDELAGVDRERDAAQRVHRRRRRARSVARVATVSINRRHVSAAGRRRHRHVEAGRALRAGGLAAACERSTATITASPSASSPAVHLGVAVVGEAGHDRRRAPRVAPSGEPPDRRATGRSARRRASPSRALAAGSAARAVGTRSTSLAPAGHDVDVRGHAGPERQVGVVDVDHDVVGDDVLDVQRRVPHLRRRVPVKVPLGIGVDA